MKIESFINDIRAVIYQLNISLCDMVTENQDWINYNWISDEHITKFYPIKQKGIKYV